MREEVLDWIIKAEADLEEVQDQLRHNHYEGAVEQAQQAFEKIGRAIVEDKYHVVPEEIDLEEAYTRIGVPQQLIQSVTLIAQADPSHVQQSLAHQAKQTLTNIITWLRRQHAL